jgi:fumarate hydratase class II
MPERGFRLERDSMGELRVPADALWGAQTQRAILNFDIAGRPMPGPFIAALAAIKRAAARANGELGLLDAAMASGSTGWNPESFDQLDELLVRLGPSARR